MFFKNKINRYLEYSKKCCIFALQRTRRNVYELDSKCNSVVA